ncbi:MAG: DUF3370 domain-containing protein [Cyanobacteria bacterium SID2]|nr:DUF3370 domain-containing protein [Cyanobacteria bacterium SID2]
MRPLPGRLDDVPVFNSNSPEVVLEEGILLSTFPPADKAHPEAHLDYAFEGRFDIFTHHIARARTREQTRTLFQGILLHNSTARTVRVEVLHGASYLTRPDALFVELPDYVDDRIGTVYSGPGSRATNDVLRGKRQGNWPAVLELKPGESRMLMNLPIPVGRVIPSSNGRSTLMRLFSDGPVYVACLAMFSPQNSDNTERIPTEEEWQQLLQTADRAGPRDLEPTPLDRIYDVERAIYSRVAGVAIGSRWEAQLVDRGKIEEEDPPQLTVPEPGRSFSYGLSTLHRGRLGTEQIQSAQLVRRYPDTAYYAHGNYGIEYNLTLPLFNPSNNSRKVSLLFQTPVKQDRIDGGLTFFDPPENRVFFRGLVRLQYNDDANVPQTRYVHLVQRRGQVGNSLVTLDIAPRDRRLVRVDFIYPPDSTPPQVLTVQTEPRESETWPSNDRED